MFANFRPLALAALATSLGCNTTPAASPVPTGPPTSQPESVGPVVAPAIVGTVLLSATDLPPTSGGIVYLEDGPKEPNALTAASIDIYHKQLTPFIAVITTGGTVTFANWDDLAHHVFSPDIPSWDTGTLVKNVKANKTFAAPGVVSLLCNIHPEMLGYLMVIPSTYFGRIGSDGKYAIRNVPAGTYKVTAWVPRTPTVTQSVSVGAKDIATSDFTLHTAAGPPHD